MMPIFTITKIRHLIEEEQWSIEASTKKRALDVIGRISPDTVNTKITNSDIKVIVQKNK